MNGETFLRKEDVCRKPAEKLGCLSVFSKGKLKWRHAPEKWLTSRSLQIKLLWKGKKIMVLLYQRLKPIECLLLLLSAVTSLTKAWKHPKLQQIYGIYSPSGSYHQFLEVWQNNGSGLLFHVLYLWQPKVHTFWWLEKGTKLRYTILSKSFL